MRRFLSVFALAILLGGLMPSSGAAQVPPGVQPPPGPPGVQPTPLPDAPAPDAPRVVTMPSPLVATASPEYGAAVFLLGNPETTARDVALMQSARLTWARIDIPWRSIEPGQKHNIDWDDLDRVVAALNGAGIKIMARVDHHPEWSRVVPAENGPPDNMFDYADFVSEMARRYRLDGPRGTIHAIQVWNEPNLTREWGGAIIDRNQASQYMHMLKETYVMVKAQDPTKIIVSAGLSPTGTNDGTAQPDDVYLGWLYEDGLAFVSDVIGAHGAGYGLPPEAELGSDPVQRPHPSFYFRRIEQLRAIMEANGDGGKRMWLLEFGWPVNEVAGNVNAHTDYAWYAITPEQQADYVVRAFQYANDKWEPWIGVMFVWNIADPRWTPANEQFFWSITNPDGTPRPAHAALATARSNGVLP